MVEKAPKSVLIVDDEPDLCESLAFVIEDMGFVIYTANSTAEAFQILMSQPIDIVLSDVRMPSENGVELMKRVRQHLKTRPIFILMTGFTDISEKDALAAGAAVMLRKPLKIDALQTLLQKTRYKLEIGERAS